MGTFASEEDAKAAEERAAAAPHIPGYGEDTCGSFARRWVDDFPRPAVATRKTYRYALVPFIERFDGVRLIAFDRSTGFQWAQTQPHGTTAVCRTMFTDAINAGLYRGSNPFANLRRPKPRGRRDIDVMKQDDLARLVECAEFCWGQYGRLVLGPLIEFQAYVTTRPAELYFIERSDVQGDLVYVLDSDDSTGEAKLPKNDQKRKVVLPPPAAAAIARVPPRLDAPWQFYTITGKQFNKSSLYYYWNPIRKAFGKPDLEFYELRHYGGSYMTNELELPPEVVALQMGHTDHGRLVRELYGHKEENRAREELKRRYREVYRPPGQAQRPFREDVEGA